jgi:hypothetical protein
MKLPKVQPLAPWAVLSVIVFVAAAGNLRGDSSHSGMD